MPNPYQYDRLSISIFCKIPLSILIYISISIYIFIDRDINTFKNILINIEIFKNGFDIVISNCPYRYRYRYFQNFPITISIYIEIFKKSKLISHWLKCVRNIRQYLINLSKSADILTIAIDISWENHEKMLKSDDFLPEMSLTIYKLIWIFSTIDIEIVIFKNVPINVHI